MILKTVLVPLDGATFSRQILPVVRQLVSPQEYAVRLLHVADEPVGVVPEPPMFIPLNHAIMTAPRSAADANRAAHPIYQSQRIETLHNELEEQLRADAYYFEAAGFETTIDIRFGDPAVEIIDTVRQFNIDLVAMATHGRAGVQRLVLGSVADYVVRHVSIPVLLIRPTATRDTSHTDQM